MGLSRPRHDPRRRADVLPDDRNRHRELLFDLVHQSRSEVRRPVALPPDLRVAATSAGSSGTPASGRSSSCSSRTSSASWWRSSSTSACRPAALMRSLVLLPWILPGVVAAILWRFMYDPQLGLINSFLIRVGVADQGVAWLAESSTAMGAAIVAAVWKGFPFSTVVYLAALQNVDQEQVEAAIVDGAGRCAGSFTSSSRRCGGDRHQPGADHHPHLQLFRHDLGADPRRPAERHPHLPDQDLRARLRPVPLRRGGDLRRLLDPRADRPDHALFRPPASGRRQRPVPA